MAFSFKNPASMIAGFIVFGLMIVRVVFFYNVPDSVLIGVVPDDAFYYLQMAKHRAVEGFWTFDGTSPATGFHFLYGYFLYFLYSIFGDIDWRHLYLIIGVGASAGIGMAAYFVSRTAEKLFGRKSIFLAVAPFFTSAALIQSTAMMESWLVLFFSAATIYFLSKNENPSVFGGAALLILGILGSLSRTDYGMLPAVMFSVYLLSYPLLKNYGLKRSILVLAGAVIGVAIVFIQNLRISGHLLQASAQTKLYWSSLAGHNISASIALAQSIAFPFYSALSTAFIIAALLCMACLFVYSWRKFTHQDDRYEHLHALAISLGCLLTVFGYIYFYQFNSQSLQIWYSSNFIAPIGISLAALGYVLFREKILVPAILVFCTYVYTCAGSIFNVPWPHQAGMMQAGQYLKKQNSPAVYASWNAGIIGYFSGGRLINIDGLANDEVLPYIKSNALFDYIKSRNINYLIEHELMLTTKSSRIRGGYLDERFDKCIRPLQDVDGDSPSWDGPSWGGRLRVFEVIRGCS